MARSTAWLAALALTAACGENERAGVTAEESDRLNEVEAMLDEAPDNLTIATEPANAADSAATGEVPVAGKAGTRPR